MIHIYEELGEPSRRSILRQLLSGPKNVTELVQLTDLKQPNVSNHLAKLRERGVLQAQKSGREVYYSFATEEVESIVEAAFEERPAIEVEFDLHADSLSFAKSAVAGDESTCLEKIENAIKRRASLIDIYELLIAPAMAQVGSWYVSKTIDEAQEHLASEIALRSMSRVVQAIGIVKRSSRVAVLGCAENGWHTIGLRMIADLLKVNGWRTIFLGANVPHRAFISMVVSHQPDLVLVSCISPHASDSTVTLLRELSGLRSNGGHWLIGIGGPAVWENLDRFLGAGADFSSQSLSEFATQYLPEIERTGRISDSTRSI